MYSSAAARCTLTACGGATKAARPQLAVPFNSCVNRSRAGSGCAGPSRRSSHARRRPSRCARRSLWPYGCKGTNESNGILHAVADVVCCTAPRLCSQRRLSAAAVAVAVAVVACLTLYALAANANDTGSRSRSVYCCVRVHCSAFAFAASRAQCAAHSAALFRPLWPYSRTAVLSRCHAAVGRP